VAELRQDLKEGKRKRQEDQEQAMTLKTETSAAAFLREQQEKYASRLVRVLWAE